MPGTICENASRGDVVGNVVGARGMRVEANNFEILRVNLLAAFVVAVGANVAVDGDLISDIHLVDQEAADLCIEGVGGEKLGALLFLAGFLVGPEFVDGDGDDGLRGLSRKLPRLLRDIA